MANPKFSAVKGSHPAIKLPPAASRSGTLLTRPTYSRSATVLMQEVISRSQRDAKTPDDQTTSGVSGPFGTAHIPEDTSLEDDIDTKSGRYNTTLSIGDRADGWPVSSIETYQHLCKKLKLVAMTSVMSSLDKEVICIRGRNMLDKEVLALCGALTENINIRSLQLEMNGIADRGARYLSLLLRDNSVIHSLNIAENSICSRGVACLSDMLKLNRTLRTLNISGNKLGNETGQSIGEAIKLNRGLTELILSHNNLGDTSCEHLGAAVTENEHLRVLDLSWNTFREKGSVHIAKGLASNVSLRTVCLSMNGVGFAGAKALGEALSINNTLMELHVSDCRIRDVGCIFIAKALRNNEALQVLRLSRNPWTFKGIGVLLSSIFQNEGSCVIHLDVESAPVTKDIEKMVAAIKERDPDFRLTCARTLSSYYETEGGKAKLNPRHPMVLLKEYVTEQGLRLVDLFKLFDADGSGSVSREEFIDGLRRIQVPLSDAQLDELMDTLDKDGDGEVDYGELVEGNREVRRKIRIAKQRAVAEIN